MQLLTFKKWRLLEARGRLVGLLCCGFIVTLWVTPAHAQQGVELTSRQQVLNAQAIQALAANPPNPQAAIRFAQAALDLGERADTLLLTLGRAQLAAGNCRAASEALDGAEAAPPVSGASHQRVVKQVAAQRQTLRRVCADSDGDSADEPYELSEPLAPIEPTQELDSESGGELDGDEVVAEPELAEPVEPMLPLPTEPAPQIVEPARERLHRAVRQAWGASAKAFARGEQQKARARKSQEDQRRRREEKQAERRRLEARRRAQPEAPISEAQTQASASETPKEDEADASPQQKSSNAAAPEPADTEDEASQSTRSHAQDSGDEVTRQEEDRVRADAPADDEPDVRGFYGEVGATVPIGSYTAQSRDGAVDAGFVYGGSAYTFNGWAFDDVFGAGHQVRFNMATGLPFGVKAQDDSGDNQTIGLDFWQVTNEIKGWAGVIGLGFQLDYHQQTLKFPSREIISDMLTGGPVLALSTAGLDRTDTYLMLTGRWSPLFDGASQLFSVEMAGGFSFLRLALQYGTLYGKREPDDALRRGETLLLNIGLRIPYSFGG